MPRAALSAIEPVGITSIGSVGCCPRNITEPRPKSFSICRMAACRALMRTLLSAMGVEWSCLVMVRKFVKFS